MVEVSVEVMSVMVDVAVELESVAVSGSKCVVVALEVPDCVSCVDGEGDCEVVLDVEVVLD